MTQREESEGSEPAADAPEIVTTPPLTPHAPGRRWSRVWTGVGAVVLFVLGAVVAPAANWVFDRVNHTLDIKGPCVAVRTYLDNDHGVSSDINLAARQSTAVGCFQTAALTLVDGEDFSGVIQWKNRGESRQTNVVIKLELPAGVTVVPSTTVVTNTTNPDGLTLNEDLTRSGVNFGNYAPGGAFYAQFDLHFDAPASMTCGPHRFAMFASRDFSTARGACLSESMPLAYAKEC